MLWVAGIAIGLTDRAPQMAHMENLANALAKAFSRRSLALQPK